MDIVKIVKKSYKFAQSAKEFGWCSNVFDSHKECNITETIDGNKVTFQANRNETISVTIFHNSRKFLDLTFSIDISFEDLAKEFDKAMKAEIKFWKERLKVVSNFM